MFHFALLTKEEHVVCVCRRRTHARFSGCHLVKQQPSSLSSSSLLVCQQQQQQSFSSRELKITLSDAGEEKELMKVEKRIGRCVRACVCFLLINSNEELQRKSKINIVTFDKQ